MSVGVGIPVPWTSPHYALPARIPGQAERGHRNPVDSHGTAATITSVPTTLSSYTRRNVCRYRDP